MTKTIKTLIASSLVVSGLIAGTNNMNTVSTDEIRQTKTNVRIIKTDKYYTVMLSNSDTTAIKNSTYIASYWVAQANGIYKYLLNREIDPSGFKYFIMKKPGKTVTEYYNIIAVSDEALEVLGYKEWYLYNGIETKGDEPTIYGPVHSVDTLKYAIEYVLNTDKGWFKYHNFDEPVDVDKYVDYFTKCYNIISKKYNYDYKTRCKLCMYKTIRRFINDYKLDNYAPIIKIYR